MFLRRDKPNKPSAEAINGKAAGTGTADGADVKPVKVPLKSNLPNFEASPVIRLIPKNKLSTLFLFCCTSTAAKPVFILF